MFSSAQTARFLEKELRRHESISNRLINGTIRFSDLTGIDFFEKIHPAPLGIGRRCPPKTSG